MEHTELYPYKPLHITASPLVVAGAMLLHEDKFLLLKRHPEKSYGDHWNLPAGKVNTHEDPLKGAQRELHEETGIFIPLEQLTPLHIFYIKREGLFIEFHIFKSYLKTKPSINLKLDENIAATWSSHDEALLLPLIGGGKEILDFCLTRLKQKP